MASTNDYGIAYSPALLEPRQVLLPSQLLDRGIKYVRLQWLDYTNVTRYRVLSAHHFIRLIQSPRPGVTVIKASLGVFYIALAPGHTPVGEYLYAIDLNTLAACSYAPGHAVVMGQFQEITPSPGQMSVNVPSCPRTLLKSIVDRSASAGISYLVGFETEFILLKPRSDGSGLFDNLNEVGWCTSTGLPTGALETKVLEEIADALVSAGIQLEMFHKEAAPGQYEVITGPLPPLEAADALVYTRETVYNIASKHGLRATLAPRIFLDSCGSGAHAHISVHSAQESGGAIGPAGMTTTEMSFLAALIDHFPALCAFTLPTAASYARMLDGIWSGGTTASWGSHNREATVRLCGAPGKHHFEIRQLDGTATPYLALAALLGIGTHGITSKLPLLTKDCPSVPLFQLSEAEQTALGYGPAAKKLPLDLATAQVALEQDEILRSILGEEFVKAYIVINKHQDALLQGATDEESVTKLIKMY